MGIDHEQLRIQDRRLQTTRSDKDYLNRLDESENRKQFVVNGGRTYRIRYVDLLSAYRIQEYILFLHSLKHMDNDTLLTLKFSIQRALLGEVTENLIAVTAGVKDSMILIRFYFDEHATESELENISSVGAEVIADFPDPFGIEEQVKFASREEEMEMLDFWAFMRANPQ